MWIMSVLVSKTMSTLLYCSVNNSQDQKMQTTVQISKTKDKVKERRKTAKG